MEKQKQHGTIIGENKKLLELIGLNNFEVNFNESSKRFSILIDDQLITEGMPMFLEDFEYLVNLISQKENQQKYGWMLIIIAGSANG